MAYILKTFAFRHFSSTINAECETSNQREAINVQKTKPNSMDSPSSNTISPHEMPI